MFPFLSFSLSLSFCRGLSFPIAFFTLHLLLAAPLMTDTDDNTMAATPIIDKLNGNIFAAAVPFVVLFLFLFCCFLAFYLAFNPIWLNVQRNSICKLIDKVTHTHSLQVILYKIFFSLTRTRSFAVFYVFHK